MDLFIQRELFGAHHSAMCIACFHQHSSPASIPSHAALLISTSPKLSFTPSEVLPSLMQTENKKGNKD